MVYALLSARVDGAPVDLRRYRLRPGTDSGAELRVERTGIVGWLMEGTLELTLGAQVGTLAAGDGIFFHEYHVYMVLILVQPGALHLAVTPHSTDTVSSYHVHIPVGDL